MSIKTTAFLVSFVVFLNASAQRAGLALEPYIGYGTSASVENGGNRSGEKTGCGLVYMFNDHFGISSGLQFQRYATETASGSDSAYIKQNPATNSYEEYNSVSATYNFSYLELPITLRYISSQDQKTGVFVEAGFIIGYLIDDKESRTVNITDVDTSSGGSESTSKLYLSNITPKATSLNLEGHLALGCINQLSGKLAIITELSVNKGITNVGNNSYDVANAPLSSPFYYYNKYTNFSTPVFSNYGTDFSVTLSVRLLIKLNYNSTSTKDE